MSPAQALWPCRGSRDIERSWVPCQQWPECRPQWPRAHIRVAPLREWGCLSGSDVLRILPRSLTALDPHSRRRCLRSMVADCMFRVPQRWNHGWDGDASQVSSRVLVRGTVRALGPRVQGTGGQRECCMPWGLRSFVRWWHHSQKLTNMTLATQLGEHFVWLFSPGIFVI